jgi:cation transport ATPase
LILRTDEKTHKLAFVRQTIDEMQNIVISEEKKEAEQAEQLRLEEEEKVKQATEHAAQQKREKREKEEEEERKRQQKEKASRDIRRLLTFVGIYLIIPVALFAMGLAYLIFNYGDPIDYYLIGLPFLGIPYSVILWSALGSIASMFYFVNKYNEKQFQGPLKLFRWAIARPVIGIIMGVVVYLTIMSGILIRPVLQSHGGIRASKICCAATPSI